MLEGTTLEKAQIHLAFCLLNRTFAKRIRKYETGSDCYLSDRGRTNTD